VSDEPPVEFLLFKESGAVEALLDYGHFRYHLVVEYNHEEDNCVENILMRKVWKALDMADNEEVDEARDECIDLVWPFMLADYAKRVGSKETPNRTIKLRAATKDGKVIATDHDFHMEYPPTYSVENDYPRVKTVPSTEVKGQETIDDAIFKVKVDATYCMKTVHRKLNVKCFQREIKILQDCFHPNIIRLNALVTDGDDRVEGMLLDYVANARELGKLESLSGDQYAQWSTQIHDAITYLHNKDLVWGDAKAGNVLIREDDTVVLIDFGGGFTEGWVDLPNCGTMKGDWQGYERIMEFLKAKVKE
jgi:serine/threonine protein kinase